MAAPVVIKVPQSCTHTSLEVDEEDESVFLEAACRPVGFALVDITVIQSEIIKSESSTKSLEEMRGPACSFKTPGAAYRENLGPT